MPNKSRAPAVSHDYGVRWNRIALFYTIAFSGPALFGLLPKDFSPDIALMAATFLPMAAAVLVIMWYADAQPSEALGIRYWPGVIGWWLFAVAIPVVIITATLGVDIMLPGVEYTPNMEGVLRRIAKDEGPEQAAETSKMLANSTVHPMLPVLGNAMVMGPTLNAIQAFGQEAAWRGWLLRELSPLGFWRASLVAGLLSGLWNAPAVLKGWQYPALEAYPIVGVALATSLCVAESPLAVLIQWQTHSIMATSVFRGVSNAVGSLDYLMIDVNTGYLYIDEVLVGATGIAGLIVSILAAVCIRLICSIVRTQPLPTERLDTWFFIVSPDQEPPNNREKQQ